MVQQVVLFIHHRHFATDEQQGVSVIQHPHLRRIQQLPPGDLPVGGIVAAAPGAFSVGVHINGLLAEVGFRNHFVGAGFIAAQIQKLIAVAQDGFPLLFKQVLKLGDILNDDGHKHIPGTHGRQQLVKIIRQAHIGELVHEKVDGNRQRSLVFIVRQPK